MMANTHRLIGKIILHSLYDNLGIKLNSSAFKYGCMKPDFSPALLAIPHYKARSFKTIVNMINELKEDRIPQNREQLKYFSIKLGVIVHFISDYFCHAHNNKKYDLMPVHFIYESILQNRFSKISISHVLDKFKSSFCKSFKDTDQDIESFIQNLHDKYIGSEPCMDNDIEYCFEAAMSVTHLIILSCMSKITETAA